MVDMAIIGGVSNSLNIALNISKAMLGIRDQILIQEKVIELTSEIISAQQEAVERIATQTTLVDRIRELEKQIMQMKAWETEKQRYKLNNADRGAFVYILKSGMENGEPPHWLCANCYEHGKKSLLQSSGLAVQGAADGMKTAWKCPECGNMVRVGFRVYPTTLAAEGNGNASP